MGAPLDFLGRTLQKYKQQQRRDFGMVGPGGVLTFNVSGHLACPTALKHAFARKGQIRKLSNLPPLRDKPVAVDPHLQPTTEAILPPDAASDPVGLIAV
jgi:hypothetical protein